MNFVFYKSCSFKKRNFVNFWSIPSKKWTYWSKAKLISLKRLDLFTSTPILRHIKWKLWTSIKVSHRVGKHLSICFLILFNLKAPLYLKTLHHSPISISRALPPFRSIYNQDWGNSSRVNVALKNAQFPFFLFHFFFTIEGAIIKGAI